MFAVATMEAIPFVVVATPLLARVALAPFPAGLIVKVTATPSTTRLPPASLTVTERVGKATPTAALCGVAGLGVRLATTATLVRAKVAADASAVAGGVRLAVTV